MSRLGSPPTKVAGTVSPSYLKINSYLSTDTEISADDRPMLGITGGTTLGMTHTPTTSYWLQSDFPAGDYYLISVVSWGDGTADATPEDNVIVQSLTLTPAPLDIEVEFFEVQVLDGVLDADGAELRLIADVENLSAIDASFDWAVPWNQPSESGVCSAARMRTCPPLN